MRKRDYSTEKMKVICFASITVLCQVLKPSAVTGYPVSLQVHQVAKRAVPAPTTSAPPTVPVCTSDQVDVLPTQCVTYKALGFCSSTNGDLQDFMSDNCFVTCGNCRVSTNPHPTTSRRMTLAVTTRNPITTAPRPTTSAPTTSSSLTTFGPTSQPDTTPVAVTTSSNTARQTNVGTTTTAVITQNLTTLSPTGPPSAPQTMAGLMIQTTLGQTTISQVTRGPMSNASTINQTKPRPTTASSQATLFQTSSVSTTPGPTTRSRRIQKIPAGNLTVTLVVFSGRPDPQWEITESSQYYDEITRLLGHARKDGFIYSYQNMPSRLGYKGLLLQFSIVEFLIVGPNTGALQELLLATMPGSIRDIVLVEVRSGAALPDIGSTNAFASQYNNPATRRKNNCYNYANDKITNTFAQPGKGGGARFRAMNGAAVQTAAVRDGLVVLNPQPASSSPIPSSPARAGHLVALFVDTGNSFWPGDFHWVRLDSNGRWCHKPGQSRVTYLDQNKNPIVDPRKANMGNYLFVSFMMTDKNVVNIA